MNFKPKQLVMKVRHPTQGGYVPLRAIGEYIRGNPLRPVGHPHLCHWPVMVGSKVKKGDDGKGNWWMQDGTIIPLNDPDFKGEDTDADVHSRRPIKETIASRFISRIVTIKDIT